MTYILLSEKEWHKELFYNLKEKVKANWVLIDKKESFNYSTLKKIKPSKIFIPHWSYIISENIYTDFECIVFHMTDLPYGRGGSPLQNLIVRGHTETKISALKVIEKLDAGEIYLKKNLSLEGTAQEIFVRSSQVIEEMIISIINDKITPKPQKGKETVFKRRKPSDGNIQNLESSNKIYDYIRMLDADTYPPAFLETKYFKFEFTKANLQSDQTIIANVRIIPKQKNTNSSSSS